jgi:aminoglycoside phosphotransferase (APT) family kinase protein
MSSPPTLLPDLTTLTAGLRQVLGKHRAFWDQVTVVERKSNLYESTFPSEIVTCRLGDGSCPRLFCKYECQQSNADFGHRGGVAYEAEVYRWVLQPLPLLTPRFYGSYTEADTGRLCMVLEYLDGCTLMDEADEHGAELKAARWIGRFHAANQGGMAQASLRFLNTYDEAYYVGWARRLAELSATWQPRCSWLVTLCNRFGEAVSPLLTSASTVIHGEFYPLNILIRRGTTYPIDWESCAVAAGEVDLASLTEDWPEAAVEACTREYQRARWPAGAPADFGRRLEAARLYLACRWLADEQAATSPCPWYLEQLRQAGERLRII